jgi:hypothetical protein
MNKELIVYLRDYYSLPERATDAEIEKELSNTLGATSYRVNKEREELSAAFRDAIPKWIKRLLKGLEKPK